MCLLVSMINIIVPSHFKDRKTNQTNTFFCLRLSLSAHLQHHCHGDPRAGPEVQIPFSRGTSPLFDALLSHTHGSKIHHSLGLFLPTLPLHCPSPRPCLRLRQDFPLTLLRRHFPPQCRPRPPRLRRRPPWYAVRHSPQLWLIKLR